MKRTLLLAVALTATGVWAQSVPDSALYLGQAPPGSAPVIFRLPVGAGLFPAERIAISAGGDEIYYSELDGYPGSVARIMRMRYRSNRWTGPDLVLNGFISPGLTVHGDTLAVENPANRSFIWVKTDSTRGTPLPFWGSQRQTHYLQETNAGNLYMAATPVVSSTADIARVQISGRDTTAAYLGVPLNQANNGFDFFVARDESFIIRVLKSNGTGKLYVSYRRSDGMWTNPKSLEGRVNASQGWQWGPYVTRDNKYLFYTSHAPGQTAPAVSWVRIDDLLDSLRHTNFIPYVKRPLPNQSAFTDHSFSYRVPDSTFVDDDGNHTLTFAAALNGGSALPRWLSFDGATRTFTGIPAAVGQYTIMVTVRDTAGAPTSSSFKLTVTAPSPTRKGEEHS